jgi:hypothetical protein
VTIKFHIKLETQGAVAVGSSAVLGIVALLGIHLSRARKKLAATDTPTNANHNSHNSAMLQPALMVSGSLMERP